VLAGGGVDSSVLLAEAAQYYPAVYPLYVRVGVIWEEAELLHLRRFLAALANPNLKPLTILTQPVADLHPEHWSLTGRGVPAADSADAAVFLPGRNVCLLSKPLLWCHLRKIPELATAPLATNPFPDATPEFYDGFAAIVGQAVGGSPVRVLRPYAELGLHKRDVLRRGAELPLRFTFSCLQPIAERHCGRCNKCAERHAGFIAAGMTDPTEYAHLA
jgi:7-cyano-7-deazaguanine synthase